MMRVRSKATLAHSAARCTGLAAVAVVLAACSSAPIDDPSATPNDATSSGASGAATAGSGAATAGSGTVQGGSGSVAAGPDYQKRSYPAGPYGTGLHATLENFGFLGWRDPVAAAYDETKLEEVHLADFYNPDGRTDVKLIWINASAVWCSVCQAEMRDIRDNQVHASFGPRGVQMIVTLFEDKNSGPARPIDLHNWGSKGFAIDFPLLLDPGFKLGTFFTSDATPLNMLVDARTMQVVDAQMGYSLDYWQRVDAFLATLQ